MILKVKVCIRIYRGWGDRGDREDREAFFYPPHPPHPHYVLPARFATTTANSVGLTGLGMCS